MGETPLQKLIVYSFQWCNNWLLEWVVIIFSWPFCYTSTFSYLHVHVSTIYIIYTCTCNSFYWVTSLLLSVTTFLVEVFMVIMCRIETNGYSYIGDSLLLVFNPLMLLLWFYCMHCGYNGRHWWGCLFKPIPFSSLVCFSTSLMLLELLVASGLWLFCSVFWQAVLNLILAFESPKQQYYIPCSSGVLYSQQSFIMA